MAYVASDPESIAIDSVTKQHRVIGNGECVKFVQRASGAPNHTQWTRGALVKSSSILPRTAIATFDSNGTYGSRRDGTSHAAIFIEKDDKSGIHLWDQWAGHPASQRWIRFQNHRTETIDSQGHHKLIKPINDGDNYYVIE